MNPEQLQNFLTHGAADPLPERTPLRAGPLSMSFEAGDLRYIRLGEREVIRRIYAAVRDRNWGTVPGVISDLEQNITEDSFQIRYRCEHRQKDIHFVWDAAMTGSPDGSLHLTFDGEAKTTFQRNRIGFCVLHPIHECAGAQCRAIYADGSEKAAVFPKTIAAEQPVTALHDLAGLAHEVGPGVWTELRFEGDLFETEDQRNWIDASFKTFCTPLRLPFPVEIRAGTRIRQEIHLRILGAPRTLPAAPMERKPELARLRRNDVTRRLPELGLVWAKQHAESSALERQRLAALGLAHLRLDVRASEAGSERDLAAACSEAKSLGTQMELAVHLDDAGASPAAYLADLRSQLEKADTRPTRIVVFGAASDDSTPPWALATARSVFANFAVPIGAGTNADLYQLNLQRPPSDADFNCWSMNPQVHAFDCTSIAETPEAASEQVRSARTYFPGKPLVVSPVTLKPSFNPVATTPDDGKRATDELPPEVDPRQLSLFGAAWTLAMIKALAEAGADSVTFYETIGWRGVMETETGSTCPEKFPSIPGTVFPLYHVLADVGEFAGGDLVETETADSMGMASLWLRKNGRERLILANLSREPQHISLDPFGPGARTRIMNRANVYSAGAEPERFRTSGQTLEGKQLKLDRYAIATIDFAGS
jgi:D-apionolactonase